MRKKNVEKLLEEKVEPLKQTIADLQAALYKARILQKPKGKPAARKGSILHNIFK